MRPPMAAGAMPVLPERPRVARRELPAAAADAEMSPLLERLESCLAPEPLAVDELVRQCQASAADVQEALLELELAGRIAWHPGNRVSRTAG